MGSGTIQKTIDQKFSFYPELAVNKFGTLAEMWDNQPDLSVTMIHVQNETDSPSVGNIGFVLSVRRTATYGIQYSFHQGRIFQRFHGASGWGDWELPHGFFKSELLLEATNIPNTATSYACDWNQYDYLIIRACFYNNTRATLVIPHDIFSASTTSNRAILYDPGISGLNYEIYKNGNSAVYIKGSQAGTASLGVRIHGIRF